MLSMTTQETAPRELAGQPQTPAGAEVITHSHGLAGPTMWGWCRARWRVPLPISRMAWCVFRRVLLQTA